VSLSLQFEFEFEFEVDSLMVKQAERTVATSDGTRVAIPCRRTVRFRFAAGLLLLLVLPIHFTYSAPSLPPPHLPLTFTLTPPPSVLSPQPEFRPRILPARLHGLGAGVGMCSV
jgi:hypothetical protein